ncbi:hypothetical protein IT157_10075 [bacterium]|nr:hypothetical protein [bacterium]
MKKLVFATTLVLVSIAIAFACSQGSGEKVAKIYFDQSGQIQFTSQTWKCTDPTGDYRLLTYIGPAGVGGTYAARLFDVTAGDYVSTFLFSNSSPCPQGATTWHLVQGTKYRIECDIPLGVPPSTIIDIVATAKVCYICEPN